MPKRALLATIDAKPSAPNGELATGATVIQVTQLSIGEPLSGDLQIVDNGRLIVGDDPDTGQRVLVTKNGVFNHDRDGILTFAAVTRDAAPWEAGDVFAGYQAGNFLHFDQSAGTLGLYSPAGAGFIAAADGSLYAGDTDGAHMRWNTASRAIEVRNGEDVKISLDANGDALFDGTVYAAAGRIYGTMQIDGLLRAGDVDGPAVNLGKFSRVDNGGNLIESGEIIVTDAANMPWFHVTAGGSTANGGWFHLGGTGDYPQRLTYDGADLVFDGTLYARGGAFTGDVEITDGALIWGGGKGKADSSGIYLEALPLTGGVGDTFAYVRWVNADGSTMSYLGALNNGAAGVTFLVNDMRGDAENSGVSIQANSDLSKNAYVALIASHDNPATDVASVEISSKSDNTTDITITADVITLTGAVAISGLSLATTTKTADYIATAADTVIVCNKATSMTITLPAATGSGKLYHVKSINTGVVTVDGNSSDTIDGQTTQALNQWDAMQIVDYAANAWAIL